MTKADIVNEISRSTGLEKAAVLATVEKFMEVVKDSMANGYLSLGIRDLRAVGCAGF